MMRVLILHVYNAQVGSALEAVVFFFQEGAPFSVENVKFWPVLPILGYFVTNLRTLRCPLYRPKKCGGAQK